MASGEAKMDRTKGDDTSCFDPHPRPDAEQAAAPEAKRRAAMEDFNKRTQRALAVILFIFGAAGLISVTILSSRTPQARPSISRNLPGVSELELRKAIYDATVKHLRELELRKSQLQAEAVRRPKEAAVKLRKVEDEIRLMRSEIKDLGQPGSVGITWVPSKKTAP